jgi:uncharacterized membrane protein YdjX (TVP38/TMEM64 family)
LLLVAAIGVLVFVTGWYRYLSLSELAAQREALQHLVANHLLLMLAAYILLYAATVALSLPSGAVLTLAGGFLFGWFWGGVAAVVAATLGAVIIFLIAKTSLSGSLTAKVHPFLGRLRDGFREDAFNYLLVLRLVPIVPFWLANLAPAVLGMSLSSYALATFIGIIPGTFAYSLAGSGLDAALAKQAASGGRLDASIFLTPNLIVGLVALAILALLPVVVRHFRKQPS